MLESKPANTAQTAPVAGLIRPVFVAVAPGSLPNRTFHVDAVWHGAHKSMH